MKKLLSIAALLVGAIAAGLALSQSPSTTKAVTSVNGKPEIAIFAGGCFWCMEADFEKLPGVLKVESGYTGGHAVNPTYQQVSSGTTGHAEAVRVTYDPTKISYERLLDYFWHNIDPTVDDRQFCDIGTQYRSGIYYLNEAQRAAALASKDVIEKSGQLKHVAYPVKVDSKSYPPEFQLEAQRNAEADAIRTAPKHQPGRVLTEIVPFKAFYLAEDYHQGYYRKNPVRYKLYRTQCGRDARLQHIWGHAASGR